MCIYIYIYIYLILKLSAAPDGVALISAGGSPKLTGTISSLETKAYQGCEQNGTRAPGYITGIYSMCVYIYIYIYAYMCVYIYIYIYI